MNRQELWFFLWKIRRKQKLDLMNVCVYVYLLCTYSTHSKTEHWLCVLVRMLWPLSKRSSNHALCVSSKAVDCLRANRVNRNASAMWGLSWHQCEFLRCFAWDGYGTAVAVSLTWTYSLLTALKCVCVCGVCFFFHRWASYSMERLQFMSGYLRTIRRQRKWWKLPKTSIDRKGERLALHTRYRRPGLSANHTSYHSQHLSLYYYIFFFVSISCFNVSQFFFSAPMWKHSIVPLSHSRRCNTIAAPETCTNYA